MGRRAEGTSAAGSQNNQCADGITQSQALAIWNREAEMGEGNRTGVRDRLQISW
jgi:hypothetical protein